MRIIFTFVLLTSLTGCYTTLYHPGPVRSESTARLESCEVHADGRNDTYYSEDRHLRPLVQRVESDAVEEFVELTRTRERQTENTMVALPVWSPAISVGAATAFVSSSAPEPLIETGTLEKSTSRRSFGLRKINHKTKEPDHP